MRLLKTIGASKAAVAITMVLGLVMISPLALYGKKKKEAKPATPAPAVAEPDYSKLQVPPPPDIARIRYLTHYYGAKLETQEVAQEKHKGWMDRMAGVEPGQRKGNRHLPPQLLRPLGVAVDSKGMLYVADQKVGGIFIFNTETRDTQYIRNGHEARFSLLNCLAIDDNDRLFASDGELRRVLVFDAQHKLVDEIQEGLQDPVGLAIDKENRFLYVVDMGLDQVLVYDADSLKLLRKIGTTGHNHELTTPGDFGSPHSAAVDKDGNLFVTDMLNNRVEEFDADGKFIRAFGRLGDAPGEFGRPKGIAVDSDNNVWVVDQMLDRVTIFDNRGEVIIAFGGHGSRPGQFDAAAGITIDQQNRVFITQQLPNGMVQAFRYITQDEARAELERRQAEREKKVAERSPPKPPENSAALPPH